MRITPLIMREALESAIRTLRRTWEYKDTVRRISIDIGEGLPLALGER
jgi:hypothetical protein